MRGEIPRRSFLRGVGALIALPALECMAPLSARAVSGTREDLLAGPRADGVHLLTERPDHGAVDTEAVGKNFVLENTLSPLANHKSSCRCFPGLDHDKASANGDGGGDHARANATFLTGCQAKKTSGADIRIGVSVDQLAAEKLGNETLLRSLEMSCDQVARAEDATPATHAPTSTTSHGRASAPRWLRSMIPAPFSSAFSAAPPAKDLRRIGHVGCA